MAYTRRTYAVDRDHEDLVCAELWSAGTLGLETREGTGGEVTVDAWFPGPGEDDPLRARDLPGGRLLAVVAVAEEDWLAAYRERAQPFALGRCFQVDPREPGEPEAAGVAAGRRLLRLPARNAFGTGSHESTRLALELLESGAVAGRTVVDVGTGTGVLAFAALHLGAREAVALDVDPAALLQARANCALNGLWPRLFAGEVAALAPGARFDLALVNIVPEHFLPFLPELAARLGGHSGGGEMILSGILAEKADAVLTAVARLGFTERERRSAGEWVASRVAR